jgi:hypothetical protein
VKVGSRQAFSLAELVIVLALMIILAHATIMEFRFDLESGKEISKICKAVRRARACALSTNQRAFLDYKPGKFSIFDVFGKKISEFECNLQNTAVVQWPAHVTVFDEFGFFEAFTVKCGNTKYAANTLSGMLREKTK